MQKIPTTNVAVSKLRKAAKVKAKEESIKLAVSLDAIAKQAGYDHWKHVLVCASESDKTTPTMLINTGESLYYPTLKKDPSITCVSGKTGVGKSIYLTDQILNALRKSESVIVVEGGTNQFAKAFNKTDANISIVVIEHHASAEAVLEIQKTLLTLLQKATRDTVVVLDDSEMIARKLGDDFLPAITTALKNGGSLYFSLMTSDFGDKTTFNEAPLNELRTSHKRRYVHLF